MSSGSRSHIGLPCPVTVPENTGSWCNGRIANTSAGPKARLGIGFPAITLVDRMIQTRHASSECIGMYKARSNDSVTMLARRRDATANAALSVGWRSENTVQVGTECGDRGEGLPELSLSGLHISTIFHWQGMGDQVRERMVEPGRTRSDLRQYAAQ